MDGSETDKISDIEQQWVSRDVDVDFDAQLRVELLNAYVDHQLTDETSQVVARQIASDDEWKRDHRSRSH